MRAFVVMVMLFGSVAHPQALPELIISGVPTRVAPVVQETLDIIDDALKVDFASESSRSALFITPDDAFSEDYCRQIARKLRRQRAEGETKRLFACDKNEVVTLSNTNDPRRSELWAVEQPNNIDLDLPAAWQRATGSREIIVGVIDTGIDYRHPDLVANMWTNTREVPGNNIDDDRNGYVDDIHGINVVGSLGTGDPFDDHYHGTHVAGTIGAVGNNGIGVVGAVHQVRLIGVKFLGANGSGSLVGAIRAVDYLTALRNRGEPILLSNNSWGGGGFNAGLHTAIANANSAGVLFVAAAGNNANNNDLNPYYPVSYQLPNVLGVAAVDRPGTLASFSNFGAASVRFAAPGVSILSTMPNGGYSYLSGTSMATPQVSGLLALLRSFAPVTSMGEMISVLDETGVALPGLAGRTVTGRMVNANTLLVEAERRGLNLRQPTPTPTPAPMVTPTPRPTATTTLTPSPTPTMAPGFFEISGTLRGGSAAAAGARVALYIDNQLSAVRYADANGVFSFGSILGPVSFRIEVAYAGHTFTAYSGELRGHLHFWHVGSVNSYTLSGLVRDGGGAPQGGVTVQAGPLGVRTTDAQGRFSFSMPYGTSYTLAFSKSGLQFSSGAISGTVLGATERIVIAEPMD